MALTGITETGEMAFDTTLDERGRIQIAANLLEDGVLVIAVSVVPPAPGQRQHGPDIRRRRLLGVRRPF